MREAAMSPRFPRVENRGWLEIYLKIAKHTRNIAKAKESKNTSKVQGKDGSNDSLEGWKMHFGIRGVFQNRMVQISHLTSQMKPFPS